MSIELSFDSKEKENKNPNQDKNKKNEHKWKELLYKVNAPSRRIYCIFPKKWTKKEGLKGPSLKPHLFSYYDRLGIVAMPDFPCLRHRQIFRDMHL